MQKKCNFFSVQKWKRIQGCHGIKKGLVLINTDVWSSIFNDVYWRDLKIFVNKFKRNFVNHDILDIFLKTIPKNPDNEIPPQQNPDSVWKPLYYKYLNMCPVPKSLISVYIVNHNIELDK